MTHEIGNRTFIVADVDPLDVDGVRTVAVGAILWLVAFVMLLPFYGSLEESGRTWWLWTCLAGFGLGRQCSRRLGPAAERGFGQLEALLGADITADHQQRIVGTPPAGVERCRIFALERLDRSG